MSKGGLGTFNVSTSANLRTAVTIQRSLNGWMLKLDENLHQATRDATAIVLRGIKDRFLREVDSMGVPWVVSQHSRRAYRKGGDGKVYHHSQVGRKTLMVTGKLYRSIRMVSIGRKMSAIEANATTPEGEKYGDILHYRYNWQFLEASKDDELNILNKIMKIRFPRTMTTPLG